MNFGFTEEQELLRSEVRKFLDESCPLEQVRKITEDASGPGYSRELWQQHRRARLARAHASPRRTAARASAGSISWSCSKRRGAACSLRRSSRPRSPRTRSAASGARGSRPRWLPRLADGCAIGTLALLEEDGAPGPEGVRLAGRSAGKSLTLTGEKLLRGRRRGRRPVRGRVPQRQGQGARPRRGRARRGGPLVARPARHRPDQAPRPGRASTACASSATRCSPKGSAAAVAQLFDAGALAVTAEAVGAGRGRAAAHRELRQAAHPVRTADRQLPGREAPARRDVRRHRVVPVARLLRRLVPGPRPQGPAARGLARQGLRERGVAAHRHRRDPAPRRHRLHLGVRRPSLPEARQVGCGRRSATPTGTTSASPALGGL